MFFVFAIGILLRLLMLFSTKSIWGDESFTIRLTENSLVEIFQKEFFTDVHPPFYPMIVKIWNGLFGTSELAYRSLSVIANSGIIFITYSFGKKLFGAKTGRLATLFVAISPYFLQLSNEIRSYSVLTFLTLTASYFFVLSIGKLARKLWYFLYALFTVGALYTEHYAWFWLFSICCFLLYLMFTDWPQYKKWIWIQTLVVFAGSASIIMIIYHAFYNEQIQDQLKITYHRSFFFVLKKSIGLYWHFFSGPVFSMVRPERVIELLKSSPLFWFYFMLTMSSFLLMMRSLIKLWKERRELFLWFSVLLFFPVLFLIVIYPIRLDARYLCWSVPVVFILLAYSLTTLKWKSVRHFFISVFILSSLGTCGHLIRLPTDAIHKEDWQGMVRYIFKNVGFRDAIGAYEYLGIYYSKKEPFKPPVPSFGSLEETIEAVKENNYQRLWTMHYIDTLDCKNKEFFTTVNRRMAEAGYKPSGDLIRFGGPDALTALQIYERIEK